MGRELRMKRGEARMFGPARRTVEQLSRFRFLAVIDADDRCGVAERPVNERVATRCLLKQHQISRIGGVGEGSGQGANCLSQERDATSQLRSNRRNG